jgi:hypothetical protein
MSPELADMTIIARWIDPSMADAARIEALVKSEGTETKYEWTSNQGDHARWLIALSVSRGNCH